MGVAGDLYRFHIAPIFHRRADRMVADGSAGVDVVQRGHPLDGRKAMANAAPADLRQRGAGSGSLLLAGEIDSAEPADLRAHRRNPAG